MRYFSLIILLFLSCDSPEPIEAGTVSGKTYENTSYGIKIDLPVGWSIIADHETMKLQGGGSEYKQKWERASAKTLVAAYKFADADMSGVGINSNISIHTEHIPLRSDVKTAKDYIPHYKRALQAHQVAYTFLEEEEGLFSSDVQTETVDVEFETSGIKVRKKSFFMMYGRSLLNVSLTWKKGDQDTFFKLIKAYRSIQLNQLKLNK